MKASIPITQTGRAKLLLRDLRAMQRQCAIWRDKSSAINDDMSVFRWHDTVGQLEACIREIEETWLIHQ